MGNKYCLLCVCNHLVWLANSYIDLCLIQMKECNPILCFIFYNRLLTIHIFDFFCIRYTIYLIQHLLYSMPFCSALLRLTDAWRILIILRYVATDSKVEIYIWQTPLYFFKNHTTSCGKKSSEKPSIWTNYIFDSLYNNKRI